MVESDGYLLGELHEAYPRVQGHRSRRPRETLGWRRAAASPGAGLGCGLVEVMGLGLITCGEEVVRGVHTLIAGVLQVYHRFHEVEEKERKVEQEEEREEQGEETAHVNMNMEMG